MSVPQPEDNQVGSAAEASHVPVDVIDVEPVLPDDDLGLDEHARQRIRRLPPEVGAVFLAVGVVGVIIPGPIGAPFLLAGGLVLMPNVFDRFERWIEKQMPSVHGIGMRNVNRFIDNFEKRFPRKSPPNS
ncbi:MAG: hypothetical protein JSS02_10275 [Planctomycetes bacterium]|nr:hypothetical protein [Planctomycetota bacterium]